MGPAVLPCLEARLAAARPELRAQLVEIARHQRTPAALPLFRRALRDPAGRVWKAALDGLVSLAGVEAIAVLAAAREQPPRGVAQAEWAEWVDEALQQALHPSGAAAPADERDGPDGSDAEG